MFFLLEGVSSRTTPAHEPIQANDDPLHRLLQTNSPDGQRLQPAQPLQ